MCEVSANAHQRLEQAEAVLQQRLRGRLWEVRVVRQGQGVVLRGQAINYHAKQLGQHIAIKECQLTVLANEIEVCPATPTPDHHGDDAG